VGCGRITARKVTGCAPPVSGRWAAEHPSRSPVPNQATEVTSRRYYSDMHSDALRARDSSFVLSSHDAARRDAAGCIGEDTFRSRSKLMDDANRFGLIGQNVWMGSGVLSPSCPSCSCPEAFFCAEGGVVESGAEGFVGR